MKSFDCQLSAQRHRQPLQSQHSLHSQHSPSLHDLLRLNSQRCLPSAKPTRHLLLLFAS
jgi:hypothetical protein